MAAEGTDRVIRAYRRLEQSVGPQEAFRIAIDTFIELNPAWAPEAAALEVMCLVWDN